MANWTGTTGFDSTFLEMMPDTVIFNATASNDKYGKKTFSGTNISVRARLVDDTVLVKNSEGKILFQLVGLTLLVITTH